MNELFSAQGLDCVLSGALGRFELRGAGSESHLIANAEGYVPWSCGHCEQLSPEADAPLVIVLEPGGAELSGTVLDAQGGGIAGALVSVRTDTSSGIANAVLSDADGRFSLTVLPRDVALEASADGYSRVATSVSAPARGLRLLLVPPSSISGMVISQVRREAVAGVRVMATESAGANLLPRTAESDAQGRFVFEQLPAGRYQLLALGSRWRSKPAQIALGVGEDREEFVLETFPATTLDATVEVSPERCSGGSLSLSGPVLRQAAIAADGSIHVDGLAPGTYRASIACLLDVASREAMNATENEKAILANDTLEVGTEPLHWEWDLDKPLLEELLGRERVGTLRISLEPEGQADTVSVLVSGTDLPLVRGVKHGRTIDFVLPVPGSYEAFLEQDPGTRVRAEVEQVGRVVEARLTLPPATHIAGHVVDRAGMAVPDAWVRASRVPVRTGEDEPTSIATLTDDQGAFELQAYTGPYRLRAIHPTGEASVDGVLGGAQDVALRLQDSMVGASQ